MAATPPQPGDVDYEETVDGEDDHGVVHSTGLLVAPSIVAAGQLCLQSIHAGKCWLYRRFFYVTVYLVKQV